MLNIDIAWRQDGDARASEDICEEVCGGALEERGGGVGGRGEKEMCSEVDHHGREGEEVVPDPLPGGRGKHEEGEGEACSREKAEAEKSK